MSHRAIYLTVWTLSPTLSGTEVLVPTVEVEEENRERDRET